MTIVLSPSLMDSFLSSMSLVALSEMGDKTQLLALILAARFRKPWAVMSGIFVATVLNHGLAAWLGGLVALWVSPPVLKFLLVFVFLAFALWILVPDKVDEAQVPVGGVGGAFLTTCVLFFFAEMGDKTQLATVALAARFDNFLIVTVGTTTGMLLADGLAVWAGDRFLRRLNMRWVRVASAITFAAFALGVWIWWPVS
jgi:Ca2+/H+ antiporter, TMEM165/GDT1 family